MKWLYSFLLIPALALAQPYGDDSGADYDDFDGIDDTNLEDHTPASGGSWTLVSGSANSWRIEGTNNEAEAYNVGFYRINDLSSEDQYVIFRTAATFLPQSSSYIVLRAADADNWVGVKIHGTGANGTRLASFVAGAETDDHIRFQGGADTWYKVEALGTSWTVYSGGTGATPGSWSPVVANTGSNPATITAGSSNTLPGLVCTAVPAATPLFDYAEFGVIGGTATGSIIPILESMGEL